jgi:hypothetical protein
MTNSIIYRRQRRQSMKPEFPGLSGGARRDRTDDLKLAKLPLSQLSYGPILDGSRATGRGGRLSLASLVDSKTRAWWAWEDLNLRPHAYQARALTN